MKPNSPNSAKLLTSLSTAYYLWSNIFPYENRYIAEQINDVLRSTKKEGKYSQKAMDIRYSIKNAIQDYMYSNTAMKLFEGVKNINSERRRLMLDEFDDSGKRVNQSLANYLNTLKMQEAKTELSKLPNSKRLFNKNFFRNLEFSIAKGEPSIIKYNINNNNSFNKNRPHTDLLLMYNSQEKLPDFNGDTEYTYEKLVKDLTKYALLSNTENGAISFRNYIPMAVFKKYGFDADILVQSNMSIAGGRYYNLLYNGTLNAVTSLIRNKKIETDNQSGRKYIAIPENFISDTNPERGNLNRVLREVNDKFGAEVLKLEGFKIFINQPINISQEGKSRFIRQFYQHNPTLAYKVGVKKVGITDRKMAGKFKNVSLDASEFKGIPADFIYLQNKAGEVFLYELSGKDLAERLTYTKINKLGGTGINEYNPYNEVSQSMFSDNNLTGREIEKAIKEKEEVSFNNFIEKSKTILQSIDKFLEETKQGTELSQVQQQAREVVSLFGQKDEKGNLKLLNRNLRVQSIPLDKEFGKYVRKAPEADPRLKANSIYMNSEAVGNKDEYDRAFAEEVVHAAVDNHITSFIESVQFNTDKTGRIILVPKRTEKPSNAYIDKLVSLYTEASNALVEDLIQNVPEFNGKSKREVLVYMRGKVLPSILKGGPVPYFGAERFKNQSDIDKITRYTYRLSDMHEFVAGIFTDNDFKAALSTVKYKATGQNIVQQFAEIIRKLLMTITNAVPGSVSEQTIDTVLNMINNPSPAINNEPKMDIENMQETDKKVENILEAKTNPDDSFQLSPIYYSNDKISRILQEIWDDILADETISKHKSGQPFIPAPKVNGMTPTRLYNRFVSKINKKYGLKTTDSPIKLVYGRYTKTQEEIDRMTEKELNQWNGLIASGNIEFYNITFNDTYERKLRAAIENQEDVQRSPIFNNTQVKPGISNKENQSNTQYQIA